MLTCCCCRRLASRRTGWRRPRARAATLVGPVCGSRRFRAAGVASRLAVWRPSPGAAGALPGSPGTGSSAPAGCIPWWRRMWQAATRGVDLRIRRGPARCRGEECGALPGPWQGWVRPNGLLVATRTRRLPPSGRWWLRRVAACCCPGRWTKGARLTWAPASPAAGGSTSLSPRPPWRAGWVLRPSCWMPRCTRTARRGWTCRLVELRPWCPCWTPRCLS